MYKRWKLEEYLMLPFLIGKLIIKNCVRNSNTKITNIKYGNHKRQYLLHFKPIQLDILKEKIIFFIHGGSWKHGSAKLFKFVGNYFAKQGYETFIPTYRLLPENHFPDQINDICMALKKSKDLIKGPNQKKMVIVGQSAGAQLGALLVFNQDKHTEYGIDREMFSAFISISGPLDFNVCKYTQSILNEYVNNSQILKEEANPINYVNQNINIPVFCVHGDEDPTIEIRNSINFVNKLKKYNKEKSELLKIERGHHADLVNIFFNKLENKINLNDILKSF